MDIYSPPESQLDDGSNELQKSIFWRIYFWFHIALIPLLLWWLSFIKPEVSILDFIDLLLFPIIVVALYSYTYSKKILPFKIYFWFFYFYILWVIFYDFIAPLVLKVPSYGEVVTFDIWYLLYITYIPTFYVLFKLREKTAINKNA